jgi:hypothetical protein
MHPQLRASDADRQQVVEALTAHTAAGRLTLDEFTARVDSTYRSKTCGELTAITSDLPSTTDRRQPRHTAAIAVASTATLLAVLLGIVVLLAAGVGWDHMTTMMASMSTAMGCG